MDTSALFTSARFMRCGELAVLILYVFVGLHQF